MLLFVTDRMCCCLFFLLCSADDISQHFASLNYELRLHLNPWRRCSIFNPTRLLVFYLLLCNIYMCVLSRVRFCQNEHAKWVGRFFFFKEKYTLKADCLSCPLRYLSVHFDWDWLYWPQNSNYGNYDHKRKCLKLWQHKNKYINFSSFIVGLNYTLTELEVLLKGWGGGEIRRVITSVSLCLSCVLCCKETCWQSFCGFATKE